jgi:hypothetical protein
MSIFKKIANLFKMIARIPQMIADAIMKAVEKIFRVPLDGIKTMIENFRRIICFLEELQKKELLFYSP